MPAADTGADRGTRGTGDVLARRERTPTAATTPAERHYRLASASRGLPPDLLEEASKRLGWASLLYSAVFFLAFFGAMVAGSSLGFFTEDMHARHPAHVVVAVVSILAGLGMFALARWSRLAPQTLLDVGLLFEVAGAFGIAFSEFWGIFPVWTGDFDAMYVGLSWVAIWIVVFPIIAPNTPGKILLASLVSATAPFLVVVFSQSAGATDADAPLGFFAVNTVFSTGITAGMAYVVSRWVHQFGTRLRKAREVGSYRLEERLGTGGMGEVWRARHRMLARPAAVKIIRPELLATEESTRRTIVRRFEREAQATATLGSTHTVDLYDFGTTDEGAFFYVMELLDGLSLQTLVERFGPASAGRTVYLLRQACHSLGEAHARGMIHRDVKPSNLFACRLGPDHDFVKVLDFGLVKTAEGFGSGATQLTGEGFTTGTPAFMAPEMAMGEAGVDGRADLYALGCVAYWLVTGQKVFEGETPMSVILDHVKTEPVRPSLRTEIPVPAELEEVILRCLEKEPGERPSSAAELDALLAACPTDPWGPEEAREWWTLHVPESDFEPPPEARAGGAPASPEAVTLLEREATP